MTTSTPSSPSVAGEPRTSGDLPELGAELGRCARLLHIVREEMASWIPAGLDWSAFVMLLLLVKKGPARQSEMADLALLDRSTVSRHVGHLVRAGLVERRPDPVDGRAVQLVATQPGTELAHHVLARRGEMFDQILAGWPREEVDHLVVVLRRLNQSMESHLLSRTVSGRPDGEPPASAPPDRTD